MASTFINKLGKEFITLLKQKIACTCGTRMSRNNAFCDVCSDATEPNPTLAVKITRRSATFLCSLDSLIDKILVYTYAVPHNNSVLLSNQRYRRNCDSHFENGLLPSTSPPSLYNKLWREYINIFSERRRNIWLKPLAVHFQENTSRILTVSTPQFS